MSKQRGTRQQRGVSLVVGLIMLVLITVMVTSAFLLSTSNLKSVANMQNRDEALAAVNVAMEQVIPSNFWNNPVAQQIDVDIDSDGVIDYQVNMLAPVCLGDTQLPQTGIPPSSLSLPVDFNISVAGWFQTLWELDGTVTHVATGTRVRVREGVRVLLSQVQYNTWCPTAGTPPPSPTPTPSPSP